MTYLFILLINYISGTPLHAFHVSVCEIVFDDSQRQLEITHRIFHDDLELALTKWSGQTIDILNPSDPQALDSLIGQYLQEKTNYVLNGKDIESAYLGSEREEGVMYCYQVIPSVKKLKSLQINNTVLMEIFEDQSNIIHVERDEVTKSLKLNVGESQGELVFD